MAATILLVSTMLQYVAAFLALRLVGITRHRTAWVLIACGVLLMAVRRTITLARLALADLPHPPDMAAESIALAISILMVLGVGRIAPLFLDLKRSAAEIEKSRLKLQAIMDHTPAAVYIKDPEGRFLLANKQVSRVLSLPLEDIIGRTDAQIFPAEVAASMRRNDERVLNEGRNIEFDEVVRHPDGSLHDYLSVKFPLLDADGRSEAVCGISTDITERTRAQEERRAFELKLQHAQKLESLGVMAGGIAHDFNNLLVAIIGSADLALEHPSLAADVREDLQNIQSAADAAADLCKQLLAYSGRGQLRFDSVDVSELVERMARLMEVSTSKKARIVCELAPELPRIEGDATQLLQVVMNLITNASDAIGEASGTITLSTRLETIGEEGLANQHSGAPLPPGSYLCIAVRDSGIGMSAETKARLFEPFYTTKFTGRGLGLSAVAGIIQGHQGAIALESAPGSGTLFRVLLPIALRSPRVPAVHAEPGPAEGSPRAPATGTILVIDDEPLVRRVAKKALERCGYQVLQATNGREGVDLFALRRAEIVLVLLDLTMPEMDGEQAFAELQQLEPNVRVLLSSGYDEGTTTRPRFGDSLAGFVPKPFTAHELTEAVRRALS